MKLTGLAALLLVASPLVVGCGSGDSCADVDSLTQQLADTQPDDPELNTSTRSCSEPRPTATPSRRQPSRRAESASSSRSMSESSVYGAIPIRRPPSGPRPIRRAGS